VNAAASDIARRFEELLMRPQTRVLFPTLVLLAAFGTATGNAAAAVTLTGTIGAPASFWSPACR
jgi:autotransporter translocation and assembly factor TamB